MGKKRVAKKGQKNADYIIKPELGKIPKKKLSSGILFISATYNNTLFNLTDSKGNAIMWSSAGSLGFRGAKKSTPFAAAKVSKVLAEKAKIIGMKDIDVVVKGVGSGRESAIRSFATSGIQINSIKDMTPVPHNGPTPRKPRRV